MSVDVQPYYTRSEPDKSCSDKNRTFSTPQVLVLAGSRLGAGAQPPKNVLCAGGQPAETQMFDLFLKLCNI